MVTESFKFLGYYTVNKDKKKCEEITEKIFAEVDTNNSGEVDFTGF